MIPRLQPRILVAALLAVAASSCGPGSGCGKKKRKARRKKRIERAERIAEKKRAAEEAPVLPTQAPSRPTSAQAVSADAPNILLISIDTLRADALPPYGSRRQTAPTMKTMASQGVVFQRSWSQAPSTSPTHASMFTSVYPSEHGVMGTVGRLPKHWTTLAEHLQAHGMRTWASTSSVRFAHGVQLDQGFDSYSVFSKGTQTEKTNKALEVALYDIAEEPDRPWFGFVHLMDVHAPYSVPEPHQSSFMDGRTPTVDPETTVKFLHKNRQNVHGVTDQQLEDLKAMYDGGVSFVDTRIAAIWDAVRELERPTLIVITADHGEAFFEKDYLGHGVFLYEPIVRVPMIFWGPGLVPDNEHRSTLISSVDLFPTLTAFTGLPVPDNLRGDDLSGVVKGDGELAGRSVMLQSAQFRALVHDREDGLYKIEVRNRGRRTRVYALHADPTERKDLAESRADLVVALKEEMARRRPGKKAVQNESWEMSDEEKQALEAIGYMDADH